MTLFGELNSWVKYLGVQLAAAEVDESAAEHTVTRVEALRGYDFRKVDMKQRAYEDGDYTDVKDAHAEARAYRKMVEALYKNVDRDSFHVSRELTRRTARAPRDARSERYS
jgi:aminoglycoside N3'-acetyltransferase